MREDVALAIHDSSGMRDCNKVCGGSYVENSPKHRNDLWDNSKYQKKAEDSGTPMGELDMYKGRHKFDRDLPGKPRA